MAWRRRQPAAEGSFYGGKTSWAAPWRAAPPRSPWPRGQLLLGKSGPDNHNLCPAEGEPAMGKPNRGDPRVLRLVVRFLRDQADLSQLEFGKACRVDQATISHYET